jgi:8-oxo-dGTP diphosphatase
MTDSPRHSVSVAAAVIRDDGRTLSIQRRDNGHWEPPGGVLERDESIQQCLVREVEEETGLVVEPERLTGVYQNMTRDVIALVFRCHIVSGQPHATDETRKIAWHTPEEIATLMDEAYAVRLLDAHRDAAHGPAIRVHDGRNLIDTLRR